MIKCDPMKYNIYAKYIYYKMSQVSPSMDITKRICLCTFVTIIIVILFVISPLSNFFKTSFLMKLIALTLLGYSIYLNIFQTNMLSNQNKHLAENPQLSSQINNNIICSYVYTIFLTLLFIFILKDLLFL
jgi:hypothetical protein